MQPEYLKESTRFLVRYCTTILQEDTLELNKLDLFINTKNRYQWFLKSIHQNDKHWYLGGNPKTVKKITIDQIPTKCLPLVFVILFCFSILKYNNPLDLISLLKIYIYLKDF